jgi:hypothetical protein
MSFTGCKVKAFNTTVGLLVPFAIVFNYYSRWIISDITSFKLSLFIQNDVVEPLSPTVL